MENFEMNTNALLVKNTFLILEDNEPCLNSNLRLAEFILFTNSHLPPAPTSSPPAYLAVLWRPISAVSVMLLHRPHGGAQGS